MLYSYSAFRSGMMARKSGASVILGADSKVSLPFEMADSKSSLDTLGCY